MNISNPSPVPAGFCQCGCGRRTRIAYQNHTRNGWKRGYPIRYIAGHNSREPVLAYFWSRVRKTGGCWLWTGGKFSDGYGRCKLNGRTDRAHRLAYVLAHGCIPKGLFICHHCDVKSCVRPSHLFAGSAKDNHIDAMLKGRLPVGESHGRAKLNAADARRIVRDYRTGTISQEKLANQYGVARNAIWCVVRGLHWRQATKDLF